MSIDSIKDAVRALRNAKNALAEELAETFPIGCQISWNKGGYRQFGTVICHHQTGLFVQNGHTGKKYRITIYDILGYIE